jgi:poly(hydroxyalkanoate) depolymerase family esterase
MPSLGTTVAALAASRKAPSAADESAETGLLTLTENFGLNPGQLKMLSFIPERLKPRAPLVVLLHGCGQSAREFADGAGWRTLAARHGFALLCPQQSARNNANRCFNWFQPKDTQRGQGEAESIREMVIHALADRRLDPSRVYIAGLSAGGAMTSVMLAVYPELFAAGAVLAGLPYGAASGMAEGFMAMMQGRIQPPQNWGDLVRAASPAPAAWPRVSVWQGESDHTVNPVNADQIAGQWTNLHGLPRTPTTVETTGRLRRATWSLGAGAPLVELNTLAGLGHGVPLAAEGPDGLGEAGPFRLEAGVSSTREIARFFGVLAVPKPQPTQSQQPSRPPATRRGVLSKALRAVGIEKN